MFKNSWNQFRVSADNRFYSAWPTRLRTLNHRAINCAVIAYVEHYFGMLYSQWSLGVRCRRLVGFRFGPGAPRRQIRSDKVRRHDIRQILKDLHGTQRRVAARQGLARHFSFPESEWETLILETFLKACYYRHVFNH